MTDKELADKVVSLGVAGGSDGFYYLRVDDRGVIPVSEFVRDWPVVGALMEKCQKIYVEYIDEPEQAVYARAEKNRTWDWIHGESLSRAIIEACVEALGEKK